MSTLAGAHTTTRVLWGKPLTLLFEIRSAVSRNVRQLAQCPQRIRYQSSAFHLLECCCDLSEPVCIVRRIESACCVLRAACYSIRLDSGTIPGASLLTDAFESFTSLESNTQSIWDRWQLW